MDVPTPEFDISSVDYHDISASGISDSIPYWLWDPVHRLRYINMPFNQISGTFPNNYIHISHLDLSFDNFSGPLPLFSLDFSEIGTINISKNKFNGSVSPVCNSTNKGVLALLDPQVICFLEWFLTVFKVSGEIPMWIGQRLSSLVFLSLQRNQFRGRIPYQLCGLKYLQILDLSVNKISNTIPPCLNNFTSMAKKVSLDRRIEHHLLDEVSSLWFIQLRHVDEALLTWKGTKQNYPQLGLLLAIDLFCNKLTGEIPEELSSLQELVALNLSRNFFTGKVLQKIGHLRQIEVLDLSRNKFSGNIPTSLSELTFLSVLDLSYNDLSGKIPTSTQLQSFDLSSFSHNRRLFGPPISPNCSLVEPPPGKSAVAGEKDSDEFMKWFYTGMGLGFAVGF
ncbi:receptor-like protein EIX2 [Gossypium hirsutum]|uniref:Receptor-like protein EIX2 n=1 Tax=Gossypium hirsutum TaxID=3635 RepID=A0A1U8NFX4_GOSHI|nr:receptor-like protein EIX2 [Gossypium hirsutum]